MSGDRRVRIAALLEACEQRILVLDGATGTGLQSAGLTAEHFGDAEREGCNEILNVTSPDVVRKLHESYLAAGADVVETNTFGGTPVVLAEYDIAERARELNREGARLAREVCARFDEPGRLRFVCGSMGPTTKAISVTGGISFPDLVDNFRIQALGLVEGGADYLLLETCQDTRNIKAGLAGIDAAFEELDESIPVAVSVTIETNGTMLAGQDAEALGVSLLHADLFYIGINCGTGPDLMTDALRTLSGICRTRIGCVPNAGLPDEDGNYALTPDEMAAWVERFVEEGWVNVTGGCCGTDAKHVEALCEMVRRRRPRAIPHHDRVLLSGIEAVELTDENRPLLIGERTNVLGSRKFKRLIEAEEYEAAAEVGRAQVARGAQVVDICMQNPDRDEADDMERLLDRLTRMVRVPLMIDTTDADVMELALTWCQGRAVLNSINLEDGLGRFERVVPMAKRWGAALVVGLIDEDREQGMAVTLERKIEVARRSYRLLTEEFGYPAEGIFFDALVFPCGTGDANYLGSAAATIEGVRALKGEFPYARTVLGISNVSFGLPPAGREVLNSVFLHHCTLAGLDAAIVNTEKLARFADIGEEEKKLAESLIFLDRNDVEAGDKAVRLFTDAFRHKKGLSTRPLADLPVDERLSRAIIEGSKEGLTEAIDAALADGRWKSPLDIVNGPLLAGMGEVGKLFAANELIVAEVLQSAEVMKAAVQQIETHLGSSGGSTRGKVLLATVKGDVHDIGKNLVEIILSNNGYDVIDMGIKVVAERIVQAAKEHCPDVIGLSGLLVRSAQQMVHVAKDLAAAGIDTPLLIGGAALSRRFAHGRIAPEYGGFCTYAKDAMTGLELVNRLLDPKERAGLESEVSALVEKTERSEKGERKDLPESSARSSLVSTDVPVPLPRDLDRHLEEPEPGEVWSYLNEQMLYGKHLGLRGGVARLAERGDRRYRGLQKEVAKVQAIWREEGWTVRGVWRFFPARAEGNRIVIGERGAEPAAEWLFPRKAGPDGLCLADYVMQDDHVALFVATVDRAIREKAEQWKHEGEYLRSHILASLALESAEAAAEWLHATIRNHWGISDGDKTTLREIIAGRYRGKRFSFGYGACPDLAGQRPLFSLLQAEEIGVRLTESDMMDPEASVSALVFHHPDARYFSV